MAVISGSRILKNMFLEDASSGEEVQIIRECFDAVDLFVMMSDTNGKIVYLNKRAREVLGPGHDFTGENFIRSLVTREDQTRIKAVFEKFLAGNKSGSFHNLYRFRTG